MVTYKLMWPPASTIGTISVHQGGQWQKAKNMSFIFEFVIIHLGSPFYIANLKIICLQNFDYFLFASK